MVADQYDVSGWAADPIPDVSEIWDGILAAVREEARRPSRLDEYLVNGRLLVTPRQYAELFRVAHEWEDEHAALSWFPRQPPSTTGIEVVVVRQQPDPIDVGGGQVAMLGFDGHIYVFDKAVLPPWMRKDSDAGDRQR